jgi:hypothetical protein
MSASFSIGKSEKRKLWDHGVQEENENDVKPFVAAPPQIERSLGIPYIPRRSSTWSDIRQFT